MRVFKNGILLQSNSIQINKISLISNLSQFTKLRLSLLVVLSAAITFAYGADTIDWQKMFWLVLGGFLVTGASNGFNQIIEKDTDLLMKRTESRPLPQLRLSLNEALIIAITFAISGVFILTYLLNVKSGILGLAALLSYTFIYTPLKKVTPFAVFVGAFPGAIPPLLGWVAATGEIDIKALIVFGIQFIWQFPHFWAIAWKVDEDYQKAGFKMLPSPGGKDRSSAFQILIYSLTLIPVGLLPYIFGMSGINSALVVSVCGVLFTWQAFRLYKSCSDEEASKLMFASFVYLPIVQLALLIDKI